MMGFGFGQQGPQTQPSQPGMFQSNGFNANSMPMSQPMQGTGDGGFGPMFGGFNPFGGGQLPPGVTPTSMFNQMQPQSSLPPQLQQFGQMTQPTQQQQVQGPGSAGDILKQAQEKQAQQQPALSASQKLLFNALGPFGQLDNPKAQDLIRRMAIGPNRFDLSAVQSARDAAFNGGKTNGINYMPLQPGQKAYTPGGTPPTPTSPATQPPQNANFTGFNPMAPNAGSFNFYPTAKK